MLYLGIVIRYKFVYLGTVPDTSFFWYLYLYLDAISCVPVHTYLHFSYFLDDFPALRAGFITPIGLIGQLNLRVATIAKLKTYHLSTYHKTKSEWIPIGIVPLSPKKYNRNLRNNWIIPIGIHSDFV